MTEITKNWCLNMAEREGNAEIGVGVMTDPVTRVILDAKGFVEAAEMNGFDPNDALDLLREIAALAT